MLSRRERAALRRDLHLVLAALETDSLVVSADSTARELFARAMNDSDPALGWAVASSPVSDWLARGAPLEEVRIEHERPVQGRCRRTRVRGRGRRVE